MFYCIFVGNLHLRNITTEDEGTYLCKADNGLNTLMLDGLKAMMLEISGNSMGCSGGSRGGSRFEPPFEIK